LHPVQDSLGIIERGSAKSSMPLTPSSSSSSSSSVAPLEGDPSRKDEGEGGGGWRWGGAPSLMAPFGTPGAPHGGHARISSATPHTPRRVYSGDCGSGRGVRGCGCTVVGGGGFLAEGGRGSRRRQPVGGGGGGNTTTTDRRRRCPSTVRL
jgi:hypothetical protein